MTVEHVATLPSQSLLNLLGMRRVNYYVKHLIQVHVHVLAVVLILFLSMAVFAALLVAGGCRHCYTVALCLTI